MAHKVYSLIVHAIKRNELREPFSTRDFREACPGLGNGTYNAFLHKHSVGNPARSSELFERVSPGLFCCCRPFRYGL